MAFLDWLTWPRIALLAFAGAAVIGIYVYVFVPLTYKASTTIVTSQSSLPTSGLSGLALAGLTSDDNALTRMQQVVQSRRIRAVVLKKAKLEERLGLSHEKAIDWLGKATTVEAVGQRALRSGTGLKTEVELAGPSRLQMWTGGTKRLNTKEAKQMCAEVANDYMAALDEYLVGTKVKNATNTREFIQKRADEVQAKLDQTEMQLQQLQSQYLLLDPQAKAQVLTAAAKDAGTEYAKAKQEAAQAASSLEVSRKRLRREDVDRISQQVTQRNPMIVSIEDDLARLRSELSSQMAEGKSAQHPDVVVIQSEINQAQKQLTQLSDDVLQSVTRQPNPLYDGLLADVTRLEVQLAGAKARQAQLAGDMAESEKQLRNLPPVAREYVNLSRKQTILSETIGELSKQLQLAEIEVQRNSSESFSVLDPAVAPEEKSGPSTGKSAAMTFVLLAVLLTLGWAYRHGMFVDYVEDESGRPEQKQAV